MYNILYIKGSGINDVRLHKFLSYFRARNYQLGFWGWSRDGEKPSMDGVESQYLLSGGGYGRKFVLFFFYFLWCFSVFFKCLFTNLKGKILIPIDFDSAFPVYLASKFKKITYLYEVYDDFALRYRFPKFVQQFIHRIDCKIMKSSQYVIHVDENRVHYKQCKWIVIENTPNDIYNGEPRDYTLIKNKFAVIGLLSSQRGVTPIYQFAKSHPETEFLVVGRFLDKDMEQLYQALPNIQISGYVPQEELFAKMSDCCAIFSLYDPSVEINRLAASNKVYDAMMHGIPVITNKEVVNSKFIEDKNIGFVINYEYDDSWSCLSDSNFMENVTLKGTNGRQLYLDCYLFDKLVTNRLVPILESLN